MSLFYGHSFAVASIRAGDDIKTVQGNLGHATDQMKQASAARMEHYIKNVVGG